jgi:PIN domain nuclease of toxin-antitoxin system
LGNWNKIGVRKLKLDIDLEALKQEIIKNEIEILPFDFDHIMELVNLEQLHKDPFDRILICQAKAEKLVIITKDNNFSSYTKVKCIW